MKPTGQTFGAAETESSSSAIQGHASPSVIYKPANWFEPLDWRAVFDRDQPIEIDLGCGKGSFLLWAARTHPTRNFLGVERLLRRLRRVDRKGGAGRFEQRAARSPGSDVPRVEAHPRWRRFRPTIFCFLIPGRSGDIMRGG